MRIGPGSSKTFITSELLFLISRITSTEIKESTIALEDFYSEVARTGLDNLAVHYDPAEAEANVAQKVGGKSGNFVIGKRNVTEFKIIVNGTSKYGNFEDTVIVPAVEILASANLTASETRKEKYLERLWAFQKILNFHNKQGRTNDIKCLCCD